MAYGGALIFLLGAVGRVADVAAEARHRPGGSCGWRSGRSPLPFIINTAGWMLTENGRQPWIVQGLHAHPQRGSRRRSAPPVVVISIVVFLLLYGALARRRLVLDDALRPQAARRRRRPDRSSTRRRPRADLLRTLMNLAPFWFIVDRRPVDGLLGAGGVRLRRRHAARRGRPRRASAAGSAIATIGPVWDGNEVWLVVAGAAHVRRLPGLVRHHVLRRLPGVGAAAGRRSSCAGSRSSSATSGTARAGARSWDAAADRRQPARPAADRGGPGRPAARPADRRRAGVRRQLLGPAQPVLPVRRVDLGAACACCTARRSSP